MMSDLKRNLRKYCENQYIDKLTTDAADRIEALERMLVTQANAIQPELDRIEALEDALEEAVIGIQWYINEYPEAASGADDEFMDRARAALKQEDKT